ncbi:MAG: DnaJ domain-containing protein, partial [archaeon]|nr:DnaJ domain-containing protein [archaeon]
MSGQKEEYYGLLGVSRSASKGDLKKAYLLLAKKYHPDRNPAGADRFKLIKEAYEVLLDDARRAVYDRQGHAGLEREEASAQQQKAQQAASSSSSNSPFEGNGSGSGKDIVHGLMVTLEMLYTGGTRRLRVRRQVGCRSCGGSGLRAGAAASGV